MLLFSRRSFRKVVWQSSSEIWSRLHEEGIQGGDLNRCVFSRRHRSRHSWIPITKNKSHLMSCHQGGNPTFRHADDLDAIGLLVISERGRFRVLHIGGP